MPRGQLQPRSLEMNATQLTDLATNIALGITNGNAASRNASGKSLVNPKDLYVKPVSSDPNLLELQFRPHWRAFRVELFMTLMALSVGAHSLLDLMIKEGLEHNPTCTLETIDEFGPAANTHYNSINLGQITTDWSSEIFKLLYFQLAPGHWMTILQHVRRARLPIIYFFERMDATYMQVTPATYRESKRILSSAVWKVHTGCLSRLTSIILERCRKLHLQITGPVCGRLT